MKAATGHAKPQKHAARGAWSERVLTVLFGTRWRPSSDIGRLGERAAARYLRGLGYRILATNARTRAAEIDIICEDPAGDAVLVEVKARAIVPGRLDPSAESAVDAAKRDRLLHAARLLRSANQWQWRVVRVDVVAVEFERAPHAAGFVAREAGSCESGAPGPFGRIVRRARRARDRVAVLLAWVWPRKPSAVRHHRGVAVLRAE